MERVKTAWDFTVRVSRRFANDACPGRAAGLAFSTLFALVPLSAFVVAVLTAFGAFDPLIEGAQQALIQQLVPTVHEEVFAGVRQFASNTRALGFLGLFIFLATAILLIRNINISFNAIWGFRTRRGVWGKIASYTSIIVIGTTLLSASFALGPVVRSVIEAAFPDTRDVAWFRSFLLPPIFLFLTLFSLNTLVPAGKVKTGGAALGAGLSVVIWEVSKRIFVFWTTSVMKLNLIYGSLAVLPIFLIWLYLSWFFILIGVETAYAFQHRRELKQEEGQGELDCPVSTVLEHCCDAALEIAQRHVAGRPPLTAEDLDYQLGVAMSDRVRRSLAQSGLFFDTDQGLLPARSADAITVGDIVDRIIARAEPVKPEDSEGEEDSPETASRPERGIEKPATVRILETWQQDPDCRITSPLMLQAESTT